MSSMCLVGLVILIHRRISNARISALTRNGDKVLLWILVTLLLGLSTIQESADHMDGHMMVQVMTWAQHVVDGPSHDLGAARRHLPRRRSAVRGGLTIRIPDASVHGHVAVRDLPFHPARVRLERLRFRHVPEPHMAARAAALTRSEENIIAIIVNGVELADTDLEREMPAYADTPDSKQAALSAAVLRRVLLDEAAQLQIVAAAQGDEAMIEALLDHQLAEAAAPTHEECERHYLADLERWRVNERARVSHILFQVTERADLAARRQRAQQTLDELLHSDDLELRFVHFARMLSNCPNCPSGVDGGALGEIERGDTAVAFERAVFAAPTGYPLPCTSGNGVRLPYHPGSREVAGPGAAVRSGRAAHSRRHIAGIVCAISLSGVM